MTDTTETPAEMEARIRATIEAEHGPGFALVNTSTPEGKAIADQAEAFGAKPIAGTAVRVFRRAADRPDAATLEQQWRDSEPRVRIFTVEREDGTSVDYTMPAASNPHAMLRFMQKTKEGGDAALLDLFDLLQPSVEGAPSAFAAIVEETAGDENPMEAVQIIGTTIAKRLTGGTAA